MKDLELRQRGSGMVQILQLNWQLTEIELTDPCTSSQRALKEDILPCHRCVGQPLVAQQRHWLTRPQNHGRIQQVTRTMPLTFEVPTKAIKEGPQAVLT